MKYTPFPTYTLILLGFVSLLLIISFSFVFIKKRLNPEKDYSELYLRTRSWFWMILLIVLALSFGRLSTTLFFGFVSFLALKEFFSIIPMRLTDRRIIFWAYLAIFYQYYLAYTSWYGMFIIFIPVYMFLFLPMRAVFIGENKGFISSNAIIHWSLMLCVFSFSHIAYLANLPVQNEAAGFSGLVLFLLFVTQFNDVCQYVWGKTLGKHKILPKVSPNKTWGGFIGGFISTTIVAGLSAPYLTPLSFGLGFGAGALIATSGFIGDVVISSVKRDLQIKDTSSLIPGHGGLLDRIDSLMYSAPLFFHYIYYFNYA